MKITVYTTNCPQCKMLEMALASKNLDYNTVYGEEEILKRGFTSAPILEVDDRIMSYKDAIRWVNQLKAGVVYVG